MKTTVINFLFTSWPEGKDPISLHLTGFNKQFLRILENTEKLEEIFPPVSGQMKIKTYAGWLVKGDPKNPESGDMELYYKTDYVTLIGPNDETLPVPVDIIKKLVEILKMVAANDNNES